MLYGLDEVVGPYVHCVAPPSFKMSFPGWSPGFPLGGDAVASAGLCDGDSTLVTVQETGAYSLREANEGLSTPNGEAGAAQGPLAASFEDERTRPVEGHPESYVAGSEAGLPTTISELGGGRTGAWWSNQEKRKSFLVAGTGLPSKSCKQTQPCSAGSPEGEHARVPHLGDLFVPRSDFCGRVFWVYEAESGLLFFYYPEEIVGEKYPRKALRYTLCLGFRLSEDLISIGESIHRLLLQPYCVLLKKIAAELRMAELRHQYMFQRLTEEKRLFDMGRKAQEGPAATGSSPAAPSNTGGAELFFRKYGTPTDADSCWGGCMNSFVSSIGKHQWTPLPSLVNVLYENLRAAQNPYPSFPLNEQGAHRSGELSSGSPSLPIRSCTHPPPSACFTISISDRISFQVRPVLPLRLVQSPPPCLGDLPLRIASRRALCHPHTEAGMSDRSVDLLAQEVFLLANGERTVADIVFALTFHTTIRLEDVWGKVVQQLDLLCVGNISNSHPRVTLKIPFPDDGTPAGEVICCITMWRAACDRETYLLNAAGEQSHTERRNCVALWLPPTWDQVYPMVEEALLQLVAENAVRLTKPWRPWFRYRTTSAFFEMLADPCHPSRSVIGPYLMRESAPDARPPASHKKAKTFLDMWVSSGGPEEEWPHRECSVPTSLLADIYKPFLYIEVDQPPTPTAFMNAAPRGLPSSNDWTSQGSSSSDSGHEDDESDSDDYLEGANAAALCALAKFNGTTLLSVQSAMRGVPAFARFYHAWCTNACEALVRIGLLNEWLVQEGDEALEETE